MKTQLLEIIAGIDYLEVVPEDQRQLMAQSLDTFCRQAIAKFVKGQGEHGGDIRDRDLGAERQNEIYDLFWYNEAERWAR